MTVSSIGVAVIGAGMAGRAHANGYRQARTVFGTDLPEIRLVAIADLNEAFARDAAERYGYERAERDWQAVAEADDIDAVSIVVANPLHREIAEALFASGKHVLCEKPLAPTTADAEAMAAAAERAGVVGAVGFTMRRSPAISAIRELVGEGALLGRALHFNGRYFCDYAVDRQAPMSWRYKGRPGSGALADIGSHLTDIGELLCGPVATVRGGVLSTVIGERPLPVGTAMGHAAAEVSDVFEPVENEDIATYTATYASGAAGTLSVTRVAFGHPNSLSFELHCEHGAAAFTLDRPGEFTIADTSSPAATGGYRQVLVGPAHPYVARGLPMDFPGVGHGNTEFFTYQARAFLEQIAGIEALPPCPSMGHGAHNLRVLDAVVQAAEGGRTVAVQ